MKQPRKPTRNQKEILVKSNLNPEHWMVHSDDKHHIVFIHKISKAMRTYSKVA